MSTDTQTLQLNGVEIEDTFAEAFTVVGTRLIITAVDEHWARTAAEEYCGFATSVIACDAEAAPNVTWPRMTRPTAGRASAC